MPKVTITGLDVVVETAEGQPNVEIRYGQNSVRLTVADKNLNFDGAALADVITGLERVRQEVQGGARSTS